MSHDSVCRQIMTLPPSSADSASPPSQDALPSLTFAWNTCTVEAWEARLRRIERSNLIQTWPYAQTMRAIEHKMTRFGLIKEGDEELGLLQVQEINLFGALHVVILDRGPLWYAGTVPAATWRAFFRLFAQTFPRRLGRLRRFMPEVAHDDDLKKELLALGFRFKRPGYRSIWVDLRADGAQLRKTLKRGWRGALNSAERSPLQVDVDERAEALEWLLQLYDADRRARRYPGPSPELVRSLVSAARPTRGVLLLRALLGGQPIAGVLVLVHGRAATYQIGWSGAEGRKHNAHHLLLWRAMMELKELGIDWFDAGGINPETAEGVTAFKKGLGGEEFELIGLYT